MQERLQFLKGLNIRHILKTGCSDNIDQEYEIVAALPQVTLFVFEDVKYEERKQQLKAIVTHPQGYLLWKSPGQRIILFRPEKNIQKWCSNFHIAVIDALVG